MSPTQKQHLKVHACHFVSKSRAHIHAFILSSYIQFSVIFLTIIFCTVYKFVVCMYAHHSSPLSLLLSFYLIYIYSNLDIMSMCVCVYILYYTTLYQSQVYIKKKNKFSFLMEIFFFIRVRLVFIVCLYAIHTVSAYT